MEWKEIDVFKYIYLNYFCKNVKRHGSGKFIPYRNAVIDLAKDSAIHLYDESILIGVNKLKGSKSETYLRLRPGAVWNAKGGCEISYGSTIEVLSEAELDTQYFTMNSSSTVVVKKRIVLGKDVMIARNVVIYDSDFHVLECDGEEIQISKDVTIGDHVWIGANSVILKGVSIGKDSVISANTLVTKEIDEKLLIGSEQKLKMLRDNVRWKR